MGKWRAKVRSFDRCTRCRRTSPPQASDAFSSSVRREGANNTTPVLVAPPFSHSAGAAAGEAAKGEPATDGRTSGLSLSPSLFLRILIPRRISPLISPFPIVLRAPPFLSPVVPRPRQLFLFSFCR